MPDVPAVAPFTTPRAEVWRLWQLGWPVALGGLALMLMYSVDIAMVGRLGEHELGAVALGGLWANSFDIVSRGVLHGLDPVISQAFGRRDRPAAGQALVRGLLLAVLLSAPVIATYLLAEPGLALLGQPAELLPDAARYARTLVWGAPAMLGFWALRIFLQGLGIMRPATVVLVVGNLVNVLLDLVLIYGVGPLPGLGIEGCGYATSLSRWFLLIGLAWICRGQLAEWWPDTPRILSLEPLLHVLSLGVPVGVQLALEVWAFQAAGLLAGLLGTTALGAHTIALNLGAMAFMTPLGLSAGAATRVGNLIGAGLEWRRSAWLSVGMGAAAMSITCVLFLAIPRPLASLYTPEPAVVALATTLLPIAGTFQLFDGIQVMAFGVLRGAGDVRVPSVFNLVGYWLIGLPGGAWLAFNRGWGAAGIWWGLVVALALVSSLLLVRLAILGRRGVEALPGATSSERPMA